MQVLDAILALPFPPSWPLPGLAVDAVAPWWQLDIAMARGRGRATAPLGRMAGAHRAGPAAVKPLRRSLAGHLPRHAWATRTAIDPKRYDEPRLTP